MTEIKIHAKKKKILAKSEKTSSFKICLRFLLFYGGKFNNVMLFSVPFFLSSFDDDHEDAHFFNSRSIGGVIPDSLLMA